MTVVGMLLCGPKADPASVRKMMVWIVEEIRIICQLLLTYMFCKAKAQHWPLDAVVACLLYIT